MVQMTSNNIRNLELASDAIDSAVSLATRLYDEESKKAVPSQDRLEQLFKVMINGDQLQDKLSQYQNEPDKLREIAEQHYQFVRENRLLSNNEV